MRPVTVILLVIAAVPRVSDVGWTDALLTSSYVNIISMRLLMICNEQKPGENELRENGQKTGRNLEKWQKCEMFLKIFL